MVSSLPTSAWETTATDLRAAKEAKEAIYGKRMVLFAPLYTSNICVNDCLYCNFRCSNTALHRKRLSLEEIAAETAALERQGHKRILLVLGEDPPYKMTDEEIKIIVATLRLAVPYTCLIG